MASSKIKGFWQQQPTKVSTVSVSVLSFVASFDPTSSSQISLGFYPNGARPIGVISLGGATGGTNPTVIVGSSGDDNGFADELDADAVYTEGGSGALTGAVLSADTEVFGKVGASAATGGTTTVIMQYIMG